MLFHPNLSLASGTLIVSYSTGAKGERLKRVHFWLINDKQHYQLFPKENAYLDDPHCMNRTVAIENLPAGTYHLKFLVPNRDGLFETISERELVISDFKVTKIDQDIKPRYGSVHAAIAPIPGQNFPEIILSDHLGNVVQASFTGTLQAYDLLPGGYSLKFSPLEGYKSPETINLYLHPKEHFGPLNVHYTEMNSKIGNLARRRPEFEPGLLLPKQHKFSDLCDAGRLKVRGMPTQLKTNF